MQDILDGKSGLGGQGQGNGGSRLPKGCPSKESLAAMELRQIEKKLAEVVSAVADIKKALLK